MRFSLSPSLSFPFFLTRSISFLFWPAPDGGQANTYRRPACHNWTQCSLTLAEVCCGVLWLVAEVCDLGNRGGGSTPCKKKRTGCCTYSQIHWNMCVHEKKSAAHKLLYVWQIVNWNSKAVHSSWEEALYWQKIIITTTGFTCWHGCCQTQQEWRCSNTWWQIENRLTQHCHYRLTYPQIIATVLHWWYVTHSCYSLPLPPIYPSTQPSSMSDIDLLIIQQEKYPMDMPTNVVRPEIPFAPHPKMCIYFERETRHTKHQFVVQSLLLSLIYHTWKWDYFLVENFANFRPENTWLRILF